MKKNLLLQKTILFFTILLFSFSSFAQNKIRTADDLKKYDQLKHYVTSHPLPSGQTSWAVETLKKYEAELKTHPLLKNKNSFSVPPLSRVNGGAPVNDECATATVLTEQTSCVVTTGDVTASTPSMLPDSCNEYLSDSAYDVWYQFQAVTSNPYITVDGSASFDAVVFLLDACGGSILGCADAGVNGDPETITASGLIPGNTYIIRVYDYGNAIPATTTFDICVYNAPPPPANDDCANAITLTEQAFCSFTNADLAWATESMPPDECSTFTSTTGLDVWFKFVAVTSNPMVTVAGSSDFDPVVFLLDACGGSILACSDTSAGGETEIFAASGLTISNTYYLRIYDYGNGLPATTTFDVCVYSAPVGIYDLNNPVGISVFPNPTKGIFNVNFDASSAKNILTVYDVLGNLMMERTVINNKQATLDMSPFANGVYSVNVRNESGTFTQKIILGK